MPSRARGGISSATARIWSPRSLDTFGATAILGDEPCPNAPRTRLVGNGRRRSSHREPGWPDAARTAWEGRAATPRTMPRDLARGEAQTIARRRNRYRADSNRAGSEGSIEDAARRSTRRCAGMDRARKNSPDEPATTAPPTGRIPAATPRNGRGSDARSRRGWFHRRTPQNAGARCPPGWGAGDRFPGPSGLYVHSSEPPRTCQ